MLIENVALRRVELRRVALVASSRVASSRVASRRIALIGVFVQIFREHEYQNSTSISYHEGS
jgi:hypothetical protein